jgi:glycosyltransferase involved in cell wall biosynthesis
MKKSKLLCILHRSPPSHGAAKVGDFIASSQKLKESFDCRFITIKSSDTIGEIGKVNFKKFYLVAELYFKIVWALLVFRPQEIYFTASVRSVAFYRDLLLSTLWKAYKFIKPIEIYYHYHTKGIDDFVSASKRNLQLTRYFLKDVNLVLLSPLLEDDFAKVQTYKSVSYLPNGVENSYNDAQFESYISNKVFDNINILYLSNMIKSKGYFHVLKLANQTKDLSIQYHFAGGWQDSTDEKEFFEYIKNNDLEKRVTFHGFINGKQKQELFEKSHLFIFPTRYHNEAFPLSVLEAFSYGLPVLATDEGSIPYILDDRSGIIVKDLSQLQIKLEEAMDTLINSETSKYCRKRYINNFSLEQFEENLVRIFK